jgi:hypothetical protein
VRYERGIYVIIGHVAGIAANAMWISFIIAAFIPEPIGKAGGNDYSMWKYTFTPTYAGTIREGINRIISKLLCWSCIELKECWECELCCLGLYLLGSKQLYYSCYQEVNQ